MRVIVTGGAGFIGSHLVDQLLAEGNTVHVIDDLSSGSLDNLMDAIRLGERFSFRMLSLLDPLVEAEVAAFKPEVIFHLAAQSSVTVSVATPLADAQVNVIGTLHLLEAARRNGVRKVLFAASGGTLYGDVDPSDDPASEQAEHRPASPYGIAKRAALDYLDFYRRQGLVDSSALALANVYGPRQDPTGEAGVVSIFTHRACSNTSLVIYGDGQQSRDFVHVSDVVDAFVRAASGSCPPLINIGTSLDTSVEELARTIVRISGTTSSIEFRPARSSEVRRSVLDAGLAEKELGWRPNIGLAEGIATLISEIRGDLVTHG